MKLSLWELPALDLRTRRTPWTQHDCARECVEPHAARHGLARVNLTKLTLDALPHDAGLDDRDEEQAVHNHHDNEERALSGSRCGGEERDAEENDEEQNHHWEDEL